MSKEPRSLPLGSRARRTMRARRCGQMPRQPSSRAQLRESRAWAWIVLPGWEDAMKQRSQETTPLWVWFSLGLLVIAIIAYAVGYLMFEQINPD